MITALDILIKDIQDFLSKKEEIKYRYTGTKSYFDFTDTTLIDFEVGSMLMNGLIRIVIKSSKSDEPDLKIPGFKILVQAEQVKNNEFYNDPELRMQIDADISELQIHLNMN